MANPKNKMLPMPMKYRVKTTKFDKNILPFRRGDTVEYIGKNDFWTGQHIIHECQTIGDGSYEYSTDQGAWINHEDFKLISKSSAESRKKLFDILKEEEESNYEEL